MIALATGVYIKQRPAVDRTTYTQQLAGITYKTPPKEPTCQLPDISNISVPIQEAKIPNSIDTNIWKQYSNDYAKIKFKYPLNWELSSERDGCWQDELSQGCSFEVNFKLVDDNSTITLKADGVSENYSVPRGFHSFGGFTEDSRGNNSQEFCNENKEFIF